MPKPRKNRNFGGDSVYARRAKRDGMVGDAPEPERPGPAPEITAGRISVTRARIRSNELIALLEAHVFRERYKGRLVTLSPDRIAAIKVLLAKSVPDVARIVHAGDPEAPLEHVVRAGADAVAGAATSGDAAIGYEHLMRGGKGDKPAEATQH